MKSHDLTVVFRPIGSLTPYANNARTHSPEQVEQIAESIRAFGFVNPVLIDSDGGIIAGHGRVEAAHLLGMAEVPVILLSNLSESERRALILADNRIAMNAGWDIDLLRDEMISVRDEGGFDLELLGFGTEELSLIDDGPAPLAKTAEFGYQEKYAVLVECKDEAHQEVVFNQLKGMGMSCKVLVN